MKKYLDLQKGDNDHYFKMKSNIAGGFHLRLQVIFIIDSLFKIIKVISRNILYVKSQDLSAFVSQKQMVCMFVSYKVWFGYKSRSADDILAFGSESQGSFILCE